MKQEKKGAEGDGGEEADRERKGEGQGQWIGKQEDPVMLDTCRYSPYEDLSEYEKEMEDVARVTPLSPKNRPPDVRWNDRQVDPNLPNTKTQGSRLGVCQHKSLCGARNTPGHEPTALEPGGWKGSSPGLARNSLPKTHGRHNTGYEEDRYEGIMEARWLVGGQRRAGKTTSSVVIFLNRIVSFHVQEGQMQAKVRGRWLSVSIYDFERWRKRPEESDW